MVDVLRIPRRLIPVDSGTLLAGQFLTIIQESARMYEQSYMNITWLITGFFVKSRDPGNIPGYGGPCTRLS